MYLRLASTLLVMAVSLASLGVPIAPGVVGDTNGDRQVDVLDLQRVVAQVLDDAADEPRGDANADGQVNVLDFQCILGQAKAPAPVQKESPRKREQRAVLKRRHGLLAGRTDTRRVAFAGSEEKPCDAQRQVFRAPVARYSPRLGRYMFHLSCHAPPVKA